MRARISYIIKISALIFRADILFALLATHYCRLGLPLSQRELAPLHWSFQR